MNALHKIATERHHFKMNMFKNAKLSTAKICTGTYPYSGTVLFTTEGEGLSTNWMKRLVFSTGIGGELLRIFS
jgi:hypothetical protein